MGFDLPNCKRMSCELLPVLCRETKKGFQYGGRNSIPRGDFDKGGESANVFGWAEGPAQEKKVFPQMTLVVEGGYSLESDRL